MWFNINPIIMESDIQDIIELSITDFLDISNPTIEKLTGDNKLSNVYVIDNKYLIKIVTRRHVEYHRLLTIFWNASLSYSRCDSFFEPFDSPYEMVKQEYMMAEKMRDTDIKTPKPINYGEYSDCGVIILEYIPNAIQFGDINTDNSIDMAHMLFSEVKKLHDKNIAHGDLQQDNILISNDELYIIDANNINNNVTEYKYYDIASVIATASKVLNSEKSINIARKYFSDESIKKSVDFIDIIAIQSGHDTNRSKIKKEIQSI